MLFTADSSEVERIFSEIRDGLSSCVGQAREDTNDGGYAIREIATFEPASVGDARFALRVREAGVDANLSEGRLVLVRSGDVLLMITVVEQFYVGGFTGQWPDPLLTDADLDAAVATAMNKLG